MKRAKRVILALDLGGTAYRVGLVERSGRLLHRSSHPTIVREGVEGILARVFQSLRELLKDAGPNTAEAIGIAAPGPINPETGVIFKAPNMPGWEDIPLKELCEEEFGIPAFAGNDANLAALAEHAFGAGRGVDDLIYITISTGIGGGIISDGRLFLGSQGLAGEVGHMTIDRHGPRCRCGNVGCLEVLASGTAIAGIAVQRIADGERSAISSLVGGRLEEVTAEIVATAAYNGDALARNIIKKAALDMGAGLVNLFHLFNPKLIIIGGGVSKAWPLFSVHINSYIAEHAMPHFYEYVPIVPAALGDDAGLLGAAALAIKHS
ncbi:MAG: ROK family protein [Chloroflexi bacterium]|nr:ROK family protein [Chloroflexota bacterium]